MTYRIYLRDKDRNRIAEIEDWTSLELVLRFNNTSAWVLDVPAGSDASNLLTATPVAGIIVERNNVTLLSGPVRQRERTWNEQTDTVVISGVDDTWFLLSRLATPPTIATNYYQEYDVRIGAAETVMQQYVYYNLGGGAGPARQIPGITLALDYGRGGTVYGRARFSTVLEVLQELATIARLGFRVVQVGTSLEFQVYQPADRSATARFGQELGNLSGYEFYEKSPEASLVYVAGQGEGASRVIIERQSPGAIAQFGRIEVFRDARDAETMPELEQRGDQELDERAATSELRISPIDTDLVSFGSDYFLGDTVTLTVDDVPVTDVVREVVIRLTAERGEELRWNGRVTELPQQASLRRLRSRLSRIERT